MGTFGSVLRGSGCVNFSAERESFSFVPPLRTPPPLPAWSDPSDTVHKHFKQNSGKSEFVPREGSLAHIGKEVSRKGEEKRKTRSEPILYIYMYYRTMSAYFRIDGYIYIYYVYDREKEREKKNTKSHILQDLEAQGQFAACGRQLCRIHFRFRFMFPLYARRIFVARRRKFSRPISVDTQLGDRCGGTLTTTISI